MTTGVGAVRELATELHRAGAQVDDLTRTNQRAGEVALGAAVIPVRSGKTKATAEVLADPDGFTLAAGTAYAGLVHNRNPFFADAIHRTEDELLDLYAAHVDEALTQSGLT